MKGVMVVSTLENERLGWAGLGWFESFHRCKFATVQLSDRL